MNMCGSFCSDHVEANPSIVSRPFWKTFLCFILTQAFHWKPRFCRRLVAWKRNCWHQRERRQKRGKGKEIIGHLQQLALCRWFVTWKGESVKVFVGCEIQEIHVLVAFWFQYGVKHYLCHIVWTVNVAALGHCWPIPVSFQLGKHYLGRQCITAVQLIFADLPSPEITVAGCNTWLSWVCQNHHNQKKLGLQGSPGSVKYYQDHKDLQTGLWMSPWLHHKQMLLTSTVPSF